MTQGKKNAVAISIIVTGVLAVTGIFVYAFRINRDVPEYFHLDKRTLGQKLYKEVLEYDIENTYPETAEDVVALNNLLMQLNYGRIVKDQDFIRETLRLQRLLFSDFLNENNDLEEQYERVLESAEALYEKDIRLFRIDTGTVYYGQDISMCVFPLTMVMINYDQLYWNYFLKKDEEGRWKIHTWQRTDKTFRNELTD